MKKKLSIIIPAKNEEQSILQTLESLKKHVQIPSEIIVVNDHSTDDTDIAVKKYSNKNRNVLVINTKEKYGFSNAIKKGIKKSSTGVVVIVMADLCDDPITINRMYKLITEKWDIVCGSRYSKNGKKIGGPKIQNFFSALVCKSLFYIIGLPTKDASNSFKMFRKYIFKSVNYKDNFGVEASLDLIIRAHFKGFKITEIPTIWHGRVLGQSKFKLIERSPKYIKIYLRAIFHHFGKQIFKLISFV